jgi:8-oxo-dGTP pyrophosphatase MutT (NUDIX family)
MRSRDFQNFVRRLKAGWQRPLPGKQAQLVMVPPTRKEALERDPSPGEARPSAVLILFYPGPEQPRFILIERAEYNGVHSGQIALPGGQVDTEDNSLEDTALREAKEETGIDPEKVTILGALTKLYIPPSHFDVYPFVGYSEEKPNFHVDQTETKAILEIELSDFLNPDTQTMKTILYRTGKKVTVPCFYLRDKVVWGATAMILSELLAMLKEEVGML